jgi:hypothetical protein
MAYLLSSFHCHSLLSWVFVDRVSGLLIAHLLITCGALKNENAWHGLCKPNIMTFDNLSWLNSSSCQWDCWFNFTLDFFLKHYIQLQGILIISCGCCCNPNQWGNQSNWETIFGGQDNSGNVDFRNNIVICLSHERIFAFTQWHFRCCQSPQMYSMCGDISVLKFRWSAYGGTDWQVAFTCPVPVGSIRQDTRSR